MAPVSESSLPPGWQDPAGPPVLSDGVVTLRPPTADDVPAIVRHCRDPEMVRWTTVPHPYGEADAHDFLRHSRDSWADHTGAVWSVADAADDSYCGGIDLRYDGAGGAEVGYGVAAWARGHGVARRALALACGWGFEHGGCEVVLWWAFAGNEASRRTARAAGFRVLDRTVPLALPQRGERRDGWLGTLVPSGLVRP